MTAQQRAEKSAAIMWARDDASQWLGMTLESVGPGRAVLSMLVERHHTNGHDICHGGFIFSLADSAFAFACNSYNQIAVAQHNVITYVAPARMGERLCATADEVSLYGRSGIYDIAVTNQENALIAQFRGVSRIIRGCHFEESATATEEGHS